MVKLLLLISLIIFAGCQASGGGAAGGGIISGHVEVKNEWALTTPLNHTYASGEVLSFNLTFPLNVAVTGNPYLNVTIGSSTVQADYAGVSGNVVTFNYTVGASDVDSDGITVSPTLVLNGGTMKFNTTEDCSTTIVVPSLVTVKVNGPSGFAPVANNITPANFNEDTSSTITLSYTDADGDKATSCTIVTPVKVSVTTACSCNGAGVCTVGVTGLTDANGAAGFGYTVTTNGQNSNTAAATFTLNPVADVPVAANITPSAFSEDTQSIITLSYTDGDGDLATACNISSPTNVTVTQACACNGSGVCTVGVTGTANYNGAASFAYTVTANAQVSNSATATLSITGVNDAPVAAHITPAAFNEDVQSVITLSYTDTEGDKATVCSLSGLANVTVTQACACNGAGVCTVGVTGTANYNGAASFNYTVTAAAQSSNSASATLTINAVDDAPVANNITPASFAKDTQSVITLSYADVENDKATSCSLSGLSHVTVTQACACNGAGVCTVGVTGTSGYTGAAAFNYTVSNALTSNAATATLSITGGNPPVANNITPSAFNEDVQSIITLSYTDSDSDKATACAISSPTNVTVTQACACNGSGVCTVGVTGSPLNYNGAASFTYTVTANSDLSNSATATLSITPVDDAPVASNITPPSFAKNAQSVITLSYTDVESDQATTCSVSNTSNVTVTQACACAAGSCTVGVTGTSNYIGAASFDYTVTANSAVSNTATASLTITNTPPVANNITPAAFNEDVQSVITLSYTDAENDQAASCAITAPTNVTVTQACACSAGTCTVGVTGSPLNYNGAASFTYTVTAAGDVSNSATATLSITAVDDAPVASNITPPSFYKNAQSVITLLYTDVESDQATSCSVSNTSNVTVTQACACAAGTCTVGVTGTSNYIGSASFDYTVTANSAVSNSATASLTITSAIPVANNITPAAFNEDTQSVITLSYTDADGDQASSCAIASPINVTVTQACACSAGTCTVGVTGTTDYNGAASFTYTVTAAGDTSNSATATLSITAVDDAPVANNITPAAFNEDTQSIITLSYTDAESDLASACSVSGLTNVTVTQACACTLGACTVGVTGTADYSGTASFTYTVDANSKTSNSATASLTITAVNDAPVASNITPAAFNEDVQSVITLSYTDTEGDKATSCAISGATNVTETQACACDGSGVCTVGVTGSPLNYNGAASFNYTVTAGSASNSASATLTINAVDDAPVATNITPASFYKNAQSIMTLAYTDVESDQATSCSISGLSNVTVTQACACSAGTCTVGVTGTLNYTGSASFNYTVTANSATSNSASSTFSITSAVPVATNINPAAFNEDTQSVVTLAYTDADNDKATTCAISSPTNVTVTQACACNGSGVCTVGVTGTANYNGAASFSYTVTAAGDTSNSASATLSITAVDDAPVATNINPAAFNEDTQSVITLAYTDAESDKATTCAISSPTNVTVTQACACDGSGVCTVGVTGTTDYNGAASFTYTVTANSVTSNSATATLSITAVNDAPVANSITPAAFNEDVQSVITLSYSDAESDKATTCAISSPTNVTVTQACACNGSGVCTVGVTGTANYNGAASFAYTVTAGVASNSATATLSITAVDDAPVATAITPPSFYKNTQSVITLSYTDVESDKATSCSISGASNVSVTQACACNGAGVCTVGVTGTLNYEGAASFNYTVTANSATSNSVAATLSITDHPPVANAITPAAFNEDTQSVITLSYTDADSDKATACTISSPSNVTVTQACACNGSGVCTVGVTGTADYNGAASFNYTVTASGDVSNSATVTLSITAVDDAPVAINITPAAFNEDVISTITLSYTDAEGDFAATCATSGLSNITVTSACSCSLGTCQVGVKGTANYHGTASFNYTVTANGKTSNSASASLTISSVLDAPSVSNLTPAAFNEDTQSIITLTYTNNGDPAVSCTTSSPTNVTVTQACACSAGTCTVGVTGTANYNGSASFQFYVSAGAGADSSTATANLTINAIDDAASLGAISNQSTTPNTATGAIAFTFNDPDGSVCSAARLSMSSSATSVVANGSVTWGGTAPNCTATITPVSNAVGSTTITITANDGGLANKTTTFTLTVTGALVRWEYPLNTVITTYSFGTPGGNTSATVKVKNYGNATGTVTMSDDNGSNRITSSSTCGSLAAGATCDIVINWNNSGPGGFRQTTFTATGPYNAAPMAASGTK